MRSTGVRTAALILAGAIAALDQLTKLWVIRTIRLGDEIEVWPRVLSLTHIRNEGGAFGLLRDHPGYLLVAAVATSVAILGFLLFRSRTLGGTTVGLSLILGGAAGNLIDRFRLGYVVDFLDFHWWPQFNLADTAVTLGAFVVALWMVRRHTERHLPSEVAADASDLQPSMAEKPDAEGEAT